MKALPRLSGNVCGGSVGDSTVAVMGSDGSNVATIATSGCTECRLVMVMLVVVMVVVVAGRWYCQEVIWVCCNVVAGIGDRYC